MTKVFFYLFTHSPHVCVCMCECCICVCVCAWNHQFCQTTSWNAKSLKGIKGLLTTWKRLINLFFIFLPNSFFFFFKTFSFIELNIIGRKWKWKKKSYMENKFNIWFDFFSPSSITAKGEQKKKIQEKKNSEVCGKVLQENKFMKYKN